MNAFGVSCCPQALQASPLQGHRQKRWKGGYTREGIRNIPQTCLLQLPPKEQHSTTAKTPEIIVISPAGQLRQISLMSILKPHQLSSGCEEFSGIHVRHLRMAKPPKLPWALCHQSLNFTDVTLLNMEFEAFKEEIFKPRRPWRGWSAECVLHCTLCC